VLVSTVSATFTIESTAEELDGAHFKVALAASLSNEAGLQDSAAITADHISLSIASPPSPSTHFWCGTGGPGTDSPSTDGYDYCADHSRCPCQCGCNCGCSVPAPSLAPSASSIAVTATILTTTPVAAERAATQLNAFAANLTAATTALGVPVSASTAATIGSAFDDVLSPPAGGDGGGSSGGAVAGIIVGVLVALAAALGTVIAFKSFRRRRLEAAPLVTEHTGKVAEDALASKAGRTELVVFSDSI
jgi:hypothetical protein